MSKSNITIYCWQRSHKIELLLSKGEQVSLSKKIPKGKAVCSTCRDQGMGNETIFIQDGFTVFNPLKVFSCERGHASCIGPLGDNRLFVQFGPANDHFFNFEGSLDDLSNLIDEGQIKCHHLHDGSVCDSQLKPVDDYELSHPSIPGIKTKQRVGDIWDKQGIEPVRPGLYTDHGYSESETEAINRKRLKEIRKKRNVDLSRMDGIDVYRGPTENRSDIKKTKDQIDS